MARTKSSSRWLQEHEDDEYVRKARSEGYRSRACYKLKEIHEKYRLIKPGMVVIDLGAAPGGWCQVVTEIMGEKGQVVALDLLEMEPIPGVDFIQGDFTEASVLDALMDQLNGAPVDLVISDMAPNLSGNKSIDQPRMAYLVELALDLADTVLRPGGGVLTKCFEGEGIGDIRQGFQERFSKRHNIKPKASRNRSSEVYVLGTGFNGGKA